MGEEVEAAPKTDADEGSQAELEHLAMAVEVAPEPVRLMGTVEADPEPVVLPEVQPHPTVMEAVPLAPQTSRDMSAGHYRLTDLSTFQPDQARFYDFDYRTDSRNRRTD